MTRFMITQGDRLLYSGDGTAPGADPTDPGAASANNWPHAWSTDLPLPGWEDMSIWGQDMGTWWAQLSPNGTSLDDDPVIWLSGIPTPYRTLAALVAAIANATGAPLESVWEAIAP